MHIGLAWQNFHPFTEKLLSHTFRTRCTHTHSPPKYTYRARRAIAITIKSHFACAYAFRYRGKPIRMEWAALTHRHESYINKIAGPRGRHRYRRRLRCPCVCSHKNNIHFSGRFTRTRCAPRATKTDRVENVEIYIRENIRGECEIVYGRRVYERYPKNTLRECMHIKIFIAIN